MPDKLNSEAVGILRSCNGVLWMKTRPCFNLESINVSKKARDSIKIKLVDKHASDFASQMHLRSEISGLLADKLYLWSGHILFFVRNSKPRQFLCRIDSIVYVGTGTKYRLFRVASKI